MHHEAIVLVNKPAVHRTLDQLVQYLSGRVVAEIVDAVLEAVQAFRSGMPSKSDRIAQTGSEDFPFPVARSTRNRYIAARDE
ncbi:MAG: hypothetical protein ABI612_08860 [Betaproteobacteria bacterium]